MAKTLRISISYSPQDSEFIDFIKSQHNASLSIRLICSKWYQEHKDASQDYLDFLNGTASDINDSHLERHANQEQDKSIPTDQEDNDSVLFNDISDDFSNL